MGNTDNKGLEQYSTRRQKYIYIYITRFLCTRFYNHYRCSVIELIGSLRKHDVDHCHLKMQIRVAAIISQLFQAITLAKCVLTILQLNWNQRFRDKGTKLNICHHMLTSSTQLQNSHFTS